MRQHETDKREVVQPRERRREPFVVAGEATEASRPRETALDDPASRQQDEAALGFGVRDDLQLKAVRRRGLRWGLARVPPDRRSRA